MPSVRPEWDPGQGIRLDDVIVLGSDMTVQCPCP